MVLGLSLVGADLVGRNVRPQRYHPGKNSAHLIQGPMLRYLGNIRAEALKTVPGLVSASHLHNAMKSN